MIINRKRGIVKKKWLLAKVLSVFLLDSLKKSIKIAKAVIKKSGMSHNSGMSTKIKEKEMVIIPVYKF